MANITYDIIWREAMMELLDQLEAENPEEASLAPKELSEWACIYIKYIQIFRKLEMAYDQMVHPQKRADMKKALEACIGRMLEIRHWMVKLNRGLDFINLDDVLVDLKLTPDVLEIPVPRYFTEDRAKELDDRDRFLDALLEKYEASSQNPAASGSGQATVIPAANAAAAAAAAAAATLSNEPALAPDEAIVLIQRNERGRQARERARLMLIVKKQRQLADKRSRLGVALSHEEAVTKIQSVVRGWITRSRIRKEADHELAFIGMKPKPRDPKMDPQTLEARNLVQRKRVQLERLQEYDEAVVDLKQRVKEEEGQDMREAIQDRVNTWFIENRDVQTGDYPDFPDESVGGSKAILNPPPPSIESLLADVAGDGKGGAKGGKDKPAAAKPAAKDAGKKGKDAAADAPEVKQESVGSVFIPSIESAIQEYVTKWQDRDEADNFDQKHDDELVKEELRPLVFEQIRKQVDDEMRVLLQNLKDMVEAEKAARSGKKGKGKKGKGKKKGGKGGKKDKKGKKKKDPTADRSMESLFAELVNNGILQKCPRAHIQDYIGCYSYMGATLEKANILPDPSMAHIRQTVTEYCILPLGSANLNARAPFSKTVLLYGAEKTGKTLLAQAVAHLSGANFFNLSPRHTDGKYPGKSVAMMLHMVFKVARTMAPSVIYIDEAEKAFLTDKKKLAEFGSQEPYSRIKKELIKEVKALRNGDQVLVLGNSAQPWLCTKKDEKPFMGFWGKTICLPLPDYASRRVIWPGLFDRYHGRLNYEFDISTLAHISESYSSGHLDLVVRSMLTKRRVERLKAEPIQIPEIMQWLCKVPPTTREVDQELRTWSDKTPARAALKNASASKGSAPAAKKDKKDGKADKKKK